MQLSIDVATARALTSRAAGRGISVDEMVDVILSGWLAANDERPAWIDRTGRVADGERVITIADLRQAAIDNGMTFDAAVRDLRACVGLKKTERSIGGCRERCYVIALG